MKIHLYEKKENCCGCGACYSICALGCIEMVEDEEGFLYPQIDEEKCSGCGSCIKVCPFRVFRNNRKWEDTK